MFQVKICGITDVEDALLAADAGADAIGLNFFKESPRVVAESKARAIVEAIGAINETKRPRLVGVFVNADLEEVLRSMEIGLDCAQLHGDESPEMLAAVKGMNLLGSFGRLFSKTDPMLTTIRAFRCREQGLNEVNQYLCDCESWPAIGKENGLPHAVLLDAYTAGAYGGTGKVVDWNCVRCDREMLLGLPVILAGGLTAENVAEAIETARPDAVDTASGVEDSPGRKNEVKVRSFVAAAKAAFARAKSLS